MINPYKKAPPLEWTPDDWDPALRFWSLPFDPQLTEWLKVVDSTRPSIMAARQFAAEHARWNLKGAELVAKGWLEGDDLAWQPENVAEGGTGAARIRSEITQLQQLMQDDRERYLFEAESQADGLAEYMLAFIGASQAKHPWTVELVSCALAIGNIAYMSWKATFKRVRPSTLCAGLLPPFGPPAHPAFPSGHSTLGHLTGLLLLEIPALAQRHGEFKVINGSPGTQFERNPVTPDPLAGTGELKSPLMWLAGRLAKNRERLGLHYPSDSAAGRHLAAGLWRAMLTDKGTPPEIDCPSLRNVIAHAQAEWPTPW